MPYIDGFLLAVPTEKKHVYKAYAERVWSLFRSYGASGMSECWGDDVPDGKVTSFPMAVKKEPEETVVFAWIEWPDKATRDTGNKRMESDPAFVEFAGEAMPFDGMRMMYGGFEVLVRV